jgi:DDE family transposase
VILEIDSSESPVHGTQEQSAYNGDFESVCYHPLFVYPVTRPLFRQIVARIERLAWHPT